MVRWIFLFLLLANAISLFWFAQQNTEPQETVDAAQSNVQRIRLISEMPEGSLKLRKDKEGSVQVEKGPLWCVSFVNIPDIDKARGLLGGLRQLGVYAEMHDRVVNVVDGYLVKALVPEDLDARLSLLDYLDKQGFSVSENDLEPGLEMELGRYLEEVNAQRAVVELQVHNIKVVTIPQSSAERRYAVAVTEQVDRKLSNEIKLLVDSKYSGIKIEKKVCEGVARLGRTE